MNDIWHFVLLALAGARVARLVTTDHITEPLRDMAWRRFGGPGESGFGYLLTCNWCVTIYASSLSIFMYKIAETPTIIACTVLALSMVSSVIANRAE